MLLKRARRYNSASARVQVALPIFARMAHANDEDVGAIDAIDDDVLPVGKNADRRREFGAQRAKLRGKSVSLSIAAYRPDR